MRKKSKFNLIILIVFMIIVFLVLKSVYTNYFFNDFFKAVGKLNRTKFYRDVEEVFDKQRSFCIDSSDYNDAVFLKDIKVEKNKAYKVTCMVKTENIVTENGKSNAGANICIANTTEKSKSLVGTNDWQKLEFMFDSKNREEVSIAFRLGSYDDNAKGKAWFSDFTLEEGVKDTDKTWNALLLIFKNTDVKIDNENYKYTMTDEEISLMMQNIERFKNTAQNLSNGLINIEYETFVVNEPITSVSCDEENGNYVDPIDINEILEKYTEGKEYDHIFASIKFGDEYLNSEIYVNGWIGLGGMDYLGIGFSNIRLPNAKDSYIYRYNANVNLFPEEVFLHEFLHSLERALREYEYDFPELHDYEKYGYYISEKVGLKEWYKDYMQKNIRVDGNTYVGLDPIVYSEKPIHESNFQYSYKLDFNREPKNIIEAIKLITETGTELFQKRSIDKNVTVEGETMK